MLLLIFNEDGEDAENAIAPLNDDADTNLYITDAIAAIAAEVSSLPPAVYTEDNPDTVTVISHDDIELHDIDSDKEDEIRPVEKTVEETIKNIKDVKPDDEIKSNHLKKIYEWFKRTKVHPSVPSSELIQSFFKKGTFSKDVIRLVVRAVRDDADAPVNSAAPAADGVLNAGPAADADGVLNADGDVNAGPAPADADDGSSTVTNPRFEAFKQLYRFFQNQKYFESFGAFMDYINSVVITTLPTHDQFSVLLTKTIKDGFKSIPKRNLLQLLI